MAEDSRKRRRQPDGFLPSKKPPQRIHAPKFHSAFNASSSKLPTKPPSPQITKPTIPQSAPMRRQPVPILVPPPVKPAIPMKRHEPPTISSRPPTAVKPLSASSIFLKDPPIPLQRLVPPVPEPPAPPDTREMKPISTTHFAVLEDDDSVDLSSLLFRLNGTSSSEDPKPQVPTSPQKNKHIRGGLASRASQLFKKTHTSLYLWRTSLEARPHLRTSSDLSLLVCRIVHTIYTGSSKPCVSMTLCRIHGTPTIRPFTSRKHRIYVLLKFPDASRSSPICDFQNLREGVVLRIWQPWHEVLLRPMIQEQPQASLPLPLSNDSDRTILDENIHNTVLLCSRFTIIQET